MLTRAGGCHSCGKRLATEHRLATTPLCFSISMENYETSVFSGHMRAPIGDGAPRPD